ncbi:MAG TPA: FxLYD domain-containing protein [Spirochaetota bacterium]|nr:FxLYD domain-containing protein [Spirochaetota bacterium]
MSNLFRCSSCGSPDVRLNKQNQYQCSYCGSLYVHKERASVYAAKEIGNNKSKILLVSAAILFITLLSIAVYYVSVENRAGKNQTVNINSVSVNQDKEDPNKTTVDGSVARQDVLTDNTPGAAKKAEAEVGPLAAVRDSIGGIYFSGFYQNIGEAVITYPKVTVVLFDKYGKELKRAAGYGTRSFLLPGEKTIVRALVSGAPNYDKIEVLCEPQSASKFTRLSRIKLTILESKMNFSGRGRLDITGKVKNIDNKDCRMVKIEALVYKEGKVIGSGLAHITDTIRSSETATFSMYIPSKIDSADSFVLDWQGTPVR